jgi:rhodanese-related sulfurtransferase
MNRKTILQTAALIVAGIILALVANAFASRDRKTALIGAYPNALKVPPREVTSTQPGIASPTTTQAVVPPPAPATTTIAAQPTATAAIETVGLNPAAKTPATNSAGTSTADVKPATSTAAKNPVTPVPTPAPQSDERFAAHPDKPYVEIGFADVNSLHGKGVLFLDARRTSVYEQGHISGARTYSVWESDIDEKVNKLFEERSDPQSQALPIVIYCSGGECEDSHMLAQKLWGIQFNNVYVYKDGFPDWQQRGGAVHTGAKP